MTEKVKSKASEALPDLDDLLQCPVCYEIPTGQIFQCNEGHHVCGRCKMRLDVCPVCRAFFFGTRNYAMEELIANIRKLRAFKLGGKVTSADIEVPVEARESGSEENESPENNNVEEDDDVSSRTSVQPPKSCKGLFRCLCCKNNPERLPAARLLNHLRYFHAPDLIEGRSESGEYLQAWQFPTTPGRIVTAVRVADMGIFFLVIEIIDDSVYAWLSMATSPWVAHEYSYTLTLSGNDREAIFSDCVWSVRSCEGSLKKRGRCLAMTGADGRSLLAPTAMNGKLSVRRTPLEFLPHLSQPRVVLRVANRSQRDDNSEIDTHDLEPFLQDLQNDVARLSRAFATLGREANALVRSEAEMRARLENTNNTNNRQNTTVNDRPVAPVEPEPQPPSQNGEPETAERTHLSRNARRRMRHRLRAALRETNASEDGTSQRLNVDQANVARTNSQTQTEAAPRTNAAQNTSGNRSNNQNSVSGNTRPNNTSSSGRNNRTNPQRNDASETVTHFIGFAMVQNPSPPPAVEPGPAAPHDVIGNGSRNKKKRRPRK